MQTSNGSVSDLSALTEELSATMQDISDNASRINKNTESVAGEVKSVQRKRLKLISIPKEMKKSMQRQWNMLRVKIWIQRVRR